VRIGTPFFEVSQRFSSFDSALNWGEKHDFSKAESLELVA
jgi:hypothetical protein